MGFLILSNSEIAEYLRILFKINDIYSRYEIDDIDLLDEIDYYHNKKDYSDKEIKDLQDKCGSEWEGVLTSLCENLINKIEAKKYYEKTLKTELKQIKKIYNELHNEEKTLDDYEQIFDNKLSSIRDIVDSNFAKEERENKKFVYGLIAGLLISMIGVAISYFI